MKNAKLPPGVYVDAALEEPAIGAGLAEEASLLLSAILLDVGVLINVCKNDRQKHEDIRKDWSG